MLAKQANPFHNQILVTYKQLQVLKLREYIYNYICKLEGVSDAEACAIASLDGESRITDNPLFTQNDLKYINGRLEEIEKLNSEIYNTIIY